MRRRRGRRRRKRRKDGDDQLDVVDCVFFSPLPRQELTKWEGDECTLCMYVLYLDER